MEIALTIAMFRFLLRLQMTSIFALQMASCCKVTAVAICCAASLKRCRVTFANRAT